MSFSSSINLSSLNGSTGFRLDGVSASDASGSSVASAGDVNGDGFADLIIGAIGAKPNSNNFSGSSYVAFGKASGFTSAIDLSSLNGTTGFRLDGVASLDFSGNSVASAGDVNGDGFADLIIGANGADPNGSDSGSSYVLFGKASGFTSAINLSSLNGTTVFRLDGVAVADASGYSVASAGDVNGDGFADLIIGANEADPNGSDSGSSYVVFGKAGGFTSAINLSSLNGTTGFRLDGVAANDGSGDSVASAGDVNGDGFADLIIGAPLPPGPFITGSGSSYVVFGKASGFTSAINLSSLNGTTGFRLNGVADEDQTGCSVASAGDVNGDGFADLIVGARWADPNGGNSGSTYVVFGKSSGFTAAINLASLDGTSGFRLDGVTTGDGSGKSVAAAGDVNGDGFADLIVGADGADPNSNNSSGSSYIIFGKAGVFAASVDLSSLNGSTGFRLDGVAANDGGGYSVASAGDVNGDGRADLVIGADSAAPNGNLRAGSSYVYFSPASGGATYRGTTLADRLSGTSAGDTINGYSGNDILNGNAGDDTITGGTGNDTIDGGAGNDTVKWAPGDGNDTVTLGTGTNSIDFGVNAYTYVDSGAQRVFTIGSATVTVTDWTTGTNSVVGSNSNQAPSVTSGASASFAENATGTVYTATGTDPDTGTTLTYALGGVDAGRFNINAASGAVTFKASPDFEAPADVGGNNVYDITVTAFDGSLSSAAKAVAITVTDVVEFSIRLGSGSAADIKAELYTGPVAGIVYQLIAGSTNDIIVGSGLADFINSGAGDDAIDGGAGNDVIDGGLGSNFISGGAGEDDFFLDGRAAATSTTWSTIADFSQGERVTIWGYQPGVSKFVWVASDGAEGYKGATLHGDLDGNGLIDTSVTFTGMTQAQLPTPIYGVVEGYDYVFIG
jgi:Ca2+-binding RTX toxin-like protein